MADACKRADTARIGVILVLAASAIGCQDFDLTHNPQTVDPPIYVSIVIHNEETLEYINNENRFWDERAALIAFCQMLDTEGVMLNWQSDWTFLRACQLYDDGSGTGGLTIVEYIASLGFEVDPHAHESQYTYADVAHMIELCGVTPSGVAGGFIADPPVDSLLERFWAPIPGAMFPAQSWTADILWGAGTSGHVNEESLWASGIWRPEDNDNFMTHDDNAPLPHVGKYGNEWTDLDALIEKTAELRTRHQRHLHRDDLLSARATSWAPNQLTNFQQSLDTRDGNGNLEWGRPHRTRRHLAEQLRRRPRIS